MEELNMKGLDVLCHVFTQTATTNATTILDPLGHFELEVVMAFHQFLMTLIQPNHPQGLLSYPLNPAQITQTLTPVGSALTAWIDRLIRFLNFSREPSVDKKKQIVSEQATADWQAIQVLQPNHYLILPSGLLQQVAAAVVHKTSASTVNWLQCNPYHSNYHQQAMLSDRQLTATTLTLNQISTSRIRKDGLEMLIHLRTQTRDTTYHQSDIRLYEVLLGNLDGETAVSATLTEGLNYIGADRYESQHRRSWPLVQVVLGQLLRIQLTAQGQVAQLPALLKGLSTNFEFYLFQKAVVALETRFSTLSPSEQMRCHFILYEAAQHLSSQLVNVENTIPLIHPTTAQQLAETIARLTQFFTQQRTQLFERRKLDCHYPLAAVNQTTFALPASVLTRVDQLQSQPLFQGEKPEHVITFDFNAVRDPLTHLDQFMAQFVKPLTAQYSLLRVQRLKTGIERLVTQLVLPNRLNHWHNGLNSGQLDQVAHHLHELIKLYYRCHYHLAAEKKEELYDPRGYSERVLLFFAVFALLDSLVRSDATIGPKLHGYRLNTELTYFLSWSNAWSQLVLTDTVWIALLDQVRQYFAAQEIHGNVLFKLNGHSYCELSVGNDADKTHLDVQFALAVIDAPSRQRLLTDHVQPHQSQFNPNQLYIQWFKLTYTNAYLPLKLCHLRDVCILANAVLYGFNYPDTLNKYKDYNQPNFHLELYSQSTLYPRNPNYLYVSSYIAYFKRFHLTGFVLPEVVKLPVRTPQNHVLSLKSPQLSESEYEAMAWQRVIYKTHHANLNESNPDKKAKLKAEWNRLSENKVIATQYRQPKQLTKRDYFSLGFLRACPYLQIERVYLGLKGGHLALDQHYPLIMQALFEVIEFNGSQSLLQQQIRHTALVAPLIEAFAKQVDYLKRKPSQYLSLHLVVTLLNGLSLSTDNAQVHQHVEAVHTLIREVIQRWLSNPSDGKDQSMGQRIAVLHGLQILTYACHTTLSREAIQTLLLSRLMIERQFSLRRPLPARLFFEVMEVLDKKYGLITQGIDRDKRLLHALITPLTQDETWEHTSDWTPHPETKLYHCHGYALDVLQGKLYAHGDLIGNLPKKVYEHPDYLRAFGSDFPVARRIAQTSLQGKPLAAYELIIAEQRRRIFLYGTIASLQMVLEETPLGERREACFQAYIPFQSLTSTLPQSLIEGYTHWLQPDRRVIAIKNTAKQTCFLWDVGTQRITHAGNGLIVIPFHRLPPDNQALFRLFSNFENPTYLIAYKKSTADCIEQIDCLRFNLTFQRRGERLVCTNFQGYALATINTYETLPSLTQYLLLERYTTLSTNPAHQSLTQELMMIVPHQRVSAQAVYQPTLQLQQATLQTPPYFVYRILPPLRIFKAETLAGQLYLAYLYFRSGNLEKDAFTRANNFASSARLLALCGKNEPYDETELNTIECWLNANATQAHSVALRLKVLALFVNSLRVGFLYRGKKGTILERLEARFFSDNSNTKNFYWDFTHYLSVKWSIQAVCQLTVEEERLLLVHLQTHVSGFTLLTQYFQNFSENLTLTGAANADYKADLIQLLSRTALSQVNFAASVTALSSFQIYPLPAACNQASDVADWLTHHTYFYFYFFDLYREARNCQDVERFKLKLHCLRYGYGHSWQNDYYATIQIQMLYIVANYPNQFPATIPSILLENNQVKSHYFSNRGDSTDNQIKQFMQSVAQVCDTYKTSVGMNYRKVSTLAIQTRVPQKIPVAEPVPFVPTHRLSQLPAYPPLSVAHEHAQYHTEMNGAFNAVDTHPEALDFPLKAPLFAQGYGKTFYSDLQSSFNGYLQLKNRQYQPTVSIESLILTLLQRLTALQTVTQQTQWALEQWLTTYPTTPEGHRFHVACLAGKYTNDQMMTTLKATAHRQTQSQRLALMNPFLTSPQQTQVANTIRGYVMLETLMMQIKRVLPLLESYQSAKQGDEQALLLQTIAGLLMAERQYAVDPHPDWLLFELENNILLRKQQVTLIENMLTDPYKTMYQLNMGEGKSSVILQLLVNALADQQKIVRVNVLEPLLTVTKSLLPERFGVLLHKRLYTLPFSREITLDIPQLEAILALFKECQQNQGLLLVTPEHRLCFQLKWEETLLEYVAMKDANNVFAWDKIKPETDRYGLLGSSYSMTSPTMEQNQQQLTEMLKKLGYINATGGILKYPQRNTYPMFAKEIEKALQQVTYSMDWLIFRAYTLLRHQSQQHKQKIVDCLGLLNQISRMGFSDILDESDEILRYGKELNYTLGHRLPLPGGYWRWRVPELLIQLILTHPLIKGDLIQAQKTGKTKVLMNEAGEVKEIQLLSQPYFEAALKPLVLEFFLQSDEILVLLSNYAIFKQHPFEHIQAFLAGKLTPAEEENFVAKITAQVTDALPALDALLAAKGWLSHRILYHVFSYRHRVEYGLWGSTNGSSTKKLAIPFKAKDTPALRSEFAHPDIMIGFTVLSYVYQGLNKDQVTLCLSKLKREFNNADEILGQWLGTRGGATQITIASFEALDLEDDAQMDALFEQLRYQSATIFFYLNHFVFPDETKQHVEKISGNANTLAVSEELRGFSGTDDSKVMMPLSVRSVSHEPTTNGKMLHILSRRVNQNYESKQFSHPRDLLDAVCLHVATQPNPSLYSCALIDSGALVTGFSNSAAAHYLSENLPAHFLGVTFFDEDGEIKVKLRQHETQLLVNCHLPKTALFTYLDDAHTRGTDLKLPLNAQAIVTVGREMNKDKYMQAVMRLRQLNDKQSIITWGHHSLSQKIAEMNGLNDITLLNLTHVLNWVTHNTIDKIKRELYPFCLQNLQFIYKHRALAYQQTVNQPLPSLIQYYKDSADISLAHFYQLSPSQVDLSHYTITHRYDAFDQEMRNLQAQGLLVYQPANAARDRENVREASTFLHGKFEPGYRISMSKTDLDQDQEREQEVEIIKREEVNLPKKKVAAPLVSWNFALIFSHDFIEATLANKANQYSNPQYPKLLTLKDIFARLKGMPAATHTLDWLSPRLFATENYANTVQLSGNESLDPYLRPVDSFLLCRSHHTDYCILLSGDEANQIKKAYLNSSHTMQRAYLIHLHDEIREDKVFCSSLGIEYTLNFQEKMLWVLLKLFNGDSKYSVAEQPLLARCLGKLNANDFANGTTISVEASRQWFHHFVEQGLFNWAGFMTKKLTEKFVNTQLRLRDDDLSGAMLGHKASIESTLTTLCSQSLFHSSPTHMHAVAEIVKSLLNLRDSISEYKGSPLEEVLESDKNLLDIKTQIVPSPQIRLQLLEQNIERQGREQQALKAVEDALIVGIQKQKLSIQVQKTEIVQLERSLSELTSVLAKLKIVFEKNYTINPETYLQAFKQETSQWFHPKVQDFHQALAPLASIFPLNTLLMHQKQLTPEILVRLKREDVQGLSLVRWSEAPEIIKQADHLQRRGAYVTVEALYQCITANPVDASQKSMDNVSSPFKTSRPGLNFPIQNSAVAFFRGNNPHQESLLAFESWYYPEVCHYLIQMNPNRPQCIRVVFHDALDGTHTSIFKDQLQVLMRLSAQLKKPAVFISKEPGDNNHFIGGLVKNNQLVLINPLGITTHQSCYQILAELKNENTIHELWLSSNALQQHRYEEKGLVSCGPITVELIVHLLTQLTPEGLENFWNQLKTNEPTCHEATGLNYQGVNLDNLLPNTLKNLIDASEVVYQEQLIAIRQSHERQLKTLPESAVQLPTASAIEAYLLKCKEEAPAQVVFNALLTHSHTIDTIVELEEYGLLTHALNAPLHVNSEPVVPSENIAHLMDPPIRLTSPPSLTPDAVKSVEVAVEQLLEDVETHHLSPTIEDQVLLAFQSIIVNAVVKEGDPAVKRQYALCLRDIKHHVLNRYFAHQLDEEDADLIAGLDKCFRDVMNQFQGDFKLHGALSWFETYFQMESDQLLVCFKGGLDHSENFVDLMHAVKETLKLSGKHDFNLNARYNTEVFRQWIQSPPARNFAKRQAIASWLAALASFKANQDPRTQQIQLLKQDLAEIKQKIAGMVKKSQPPLVLEIASTQLQKNEEIGRGGFGIVRKGLWQESESSTREVAIKELYLMQSDINAKSKRDLLREATTMQRLDSVYIVKFLGVCIQPDCVSLVMEYMSKGNLFNYMHNVDVMPWTFRYTIALDVTQGLNYLHANKILHRDLKSPNVLLNHTFNAKLCDFGLAITKENSMTAHSLHASISSLQGGQGNIVGTYAWLAPEQFVPHTKPTSKADIYSYGVILWELATRDTPWKGSNFSQVESWVTKGHRPLIPEVAPVPVKELIQACWLHDPQSRPSAADALARLRAYKAVIVSTLDEEASNHTNDDSSESPPPSTFM